MSSSADCDIDTGDTTWVLIATVLVLGMMPGLSLFEAGLLRSKNTISIMTQTAGGLIGLSVLWDLVGYSLVYGPTQGGVIGNFQYGLLIGVSYSECNPDHARNIPAAAFAMFEMMFACITPLLMTGAVAERLKIKCFFIFCLLWEVLVFYPVAHWIWGGGWLNKMGALDFAGGIVIHTSAGAGALVLALMLGRRRGFEEVHGEFPPSNMPLAATGGVLLWMGWFGFNAGSALSSGALAVSTVVSTQVAGAVSGCVWLTLAWARGHPSFVALLNGVIAGLAGITPASGYISTQSTLVVGLILGVVSYYSLVLLKTKLKIDDALDVSSVHGVTGIIGSLAIGFLCDSQLAGSATPEDGLFYGGKKLIWVQPVAVVVTLVYSAFVTWVLAKGLDMTIGLRVSEEVEDHGLDLAEHGETAYHDLMHPSFELEKASNHERLYANTGLGEKTPLLNDRSSRGYALTDDDEESGGHEKLRYRRVEVVMDAPKSPHQTPNPNGNVNPNGNINPGGAPVGYEDDEDLPRATPMNPMANPRAGAINW